MATFNQQNQNVGTQYNAEVINIGESQSRQEFSAELKKFQAEFKKAIEAKAITGEAATDADYHVQKAVNQSESENADKSKLLDHLEKAKNLIGGVSGLATSLTGAISAVSALF